LRKAKPQETIVPLYPRCVRVKPDCITDTDGASGVIVHVPDWCVCGSRIVPEIIPLGEIVPWSSSAEPGV
jgi:hypothetical protein